MKTVIWTLSFVLLIFSCNKNSTQSISIDNRDILEKLQSIDNIEINEISPKNGFSRQFEIYISQPMDHSNPAGIQFQQRIFISHTDEYNPVIFMPSGYSSSPVKVSELSAPLQANQIYVAHRYMLGARPSPLDWQYLTIEQSSEDFHRVVEIFKKVYTGPWLSYGVSKNGQSALFHRRFFPEDVEATVVIGPALSTDKEDQRYETFLKTVGSISDREKIKEFQRTTLMKRDEIIPMIDNYMKNSDFHFSVMDAGKILEFEILEFPFGFWQATDGDCSQLPDSSATSKELYTYINNFGYFDFYSDELLEYYQPVYYQAYTELGWYRLIDDHLQDLLFSVPNPSYELLAPQNVDLHYNSQSMLDIVNWLQNYGNNIIYIYGENDPWSASAIESIELTNAVKIVQQGANHSIKIADLDQMDLVYSSLTQWLDIEINY